MNNIEQNHVFGRLWEQAGNNNFNRRIIRAKNPQNFRAIKFKTDGLHKVLIVEVDHRPGFKVLLCTVPQKTGLVSDEGVVTFATPIETTSLEILICQIDRWVNSFETIFGEIETVRIDSSATLQSNQDITEDISEPE